MVHIRKIIAERKEELLQEVSIESFCYFYLTDRAKLKSLPIDLPGDEEQIAAKGYMGIKVSQEEINFVLNKKPIKGLHFSNNIFQLLGIYLASNKRCEKEVETKYNQTSLKIKYLISRILPKYTDRFQAYLQSLTTNESPYREMLRFILLNDSEEGFAPALDKFLDTDLDIIDVIILEEYKLHQTSQTIVKTTFMNFSAEEIVRRVLDNFGNSVKRITHQRRKGHDCFIINDEYDVQDLLYIILKSLFPTLIDEEPTPKVGSKFNKVDLIIREEGIMIEMKMIKEKDSNENEFVEQLKNDIESYKLYEGLKHLFCFVYDPLNRTKDVNNFRQLNAKRGFDDRSFQVKVIVGN